jgi:hypothetical protein
MKRHFVLLLQAFSVLCSLTFVASKVRGEDLAETWASGFELLEEKAIEWKPLKATADESFREWPASGTVLGFPVIKARCTTSGSTLKKMYIQLLDYSPGGDATFEDRYKQLRKELPDALSRQTKVLGNPESPESGSPRGSECFSWELPEMTLTASFEPGRRVWLSVNRTPRERLEALAASNPRFKLQLNVTNTDLGDVILRNLPAVEVSNSDLLGPLQWVCGYYGWPLNESRAQTINQTFAKRYRREMLAEIGREVGHKARTLTGFDFQEVREKICGGHPVLIQRAIYQNRIIDQKEHNKRVAADSSYLLPADAEEQKKWPRTDMGLNVWLAIITGYNARRKEIIISHPGFDSQYQNLRIRLEEAQASCHEFTWFEE